jgi:hypothetical protein
MDQPFKARSTDEENWGAVAMKSIVGAARYLDESDEVAQCISL